MLSIWVLEYLAFGDWVAIVIVHLFLHGKIGMLMSRI